MNRIRNRTSLLIRKLSGKAPVDIPRANKHLDDDDDYDDDDYFPDDDKHDYQRPASHDLPPEALRAAQLPPKVTPTHIFFYGTHGSAPETRFHPWSISPFEAPSAHTGEMLWFTTTEHYLMYRKACMFADRAHAEQIVRCQTPAEAAALGGQLPGVDAGRWDRELEAIAEEGNWYKFAFDDDCRDALLATGSRRIVEADPTDRVWGIGFAADQAEGRESEWGENRLGKVLERVRGRLELIC